MSEIDYLAKRPEVTQTLSKAIKENEQKRSDKAGPTGQRSDGPDESQEVSKDASVETPKFVDVGVIAQKDMKDVEMQTHQNPLFNTGMLHYEGGWPREIDVTDDEQKQRYCKKLEKEEGYTQTIMSLCETMETTILQNSAIDVYEEYFDDLDPGVTATGDEYSAKATSSLKVINEFKDANERPTVWIAIQRGLNQDRFAVAYGPYNFQQPIKSTESLIWNVNSSNAPEQTLKCISPAVSLEFNGRENSLICAGFKNGTVGCFDTRKGSECFVTSELHISHKDYVTQALWVNSKSNSEFFSAGEDGCIKWWDLRNMSQPTDHFYCDPAKRNEPEKALVISCLEFESTVPIKYMVGTYCGKIFQFSRKARSPAEAHQFCLQGGFGPVYCIERNKANNKVFLSVGDWVPRIWHEDLREGCLMEFSLGETNLTGGCWSPTKMNGFFAIDETGKLNCYDLTLNHKQPVTKFEVSSDTLTSIRMTDNGQKALVGDVSGVVREILLPPSLYTEKRVERAAFHNLIERELKREKLVDSKKREAKLEKKRQGDEQSTVGGGKSENAPSKVDSIVLRARHPQIEEVTKNYLEEIKKSRVETHKMYAEMMHHARSLFLFDDKDMDELTKDMDLDGTDANYMEDLINVVKNEEKLKVRRRSSTASSRAKAPRRVSHTVVDLQNPQMRKYRDDPILEEPGEGHSTIYPPTSVDQTTVVSRVGDESKTEDADGTEGKSSMVVRSSRKHHDESANEQSSNSN